ncbi:XRE family transcriptional regulator [Candidatus Enterococcus clewellii]|uniref:HTH cro/C1-type domain-containing protein n=1 Tax=Candidatus Enterococcus clewellii TaxID=1834193 RepID=A0AAQ3VYW7_9ENTE
MIYDVVKNLATLRKVSINKIETDLELSSSTISKWNVSIPRADSLDKVARYLGTTSEKILEQSNIQNK